MTTDAPAPRRRVTRWDFREVNVLVLVVLLAITAILAVVGWWYRPGSTAYPTVPRRLAFTVNADARSLVTTLRRVGDDGAVLTLYDDDRFGLGDEGHGVTPRGWSVGISGLGTGRVVRHPTGGAVPYPADQAADIHTQMAIPAVRTRPPLTEVGGPSLIFEPVAPDAPLYLQVRWASDAPVRLDGAYVSAQLPGVSVSWPNAAPASLPMAMTLSPAAGDVGRFSVQATIGPTFTARSWTWQVDAASSNGPLDSQSSTTFEPVAMSAVNVSATQQESVRTFFVGVLLGIAGGAVLGVILELVKIRRRVVEDVSIAS
jgi:hypothetical protein